MSEQHVAAWLGTHLTVIKYDWSSRDKSWLEQQLLSPALCICWCGWCFCNGIVGRRCWYSCMDFRINWSPKWSLLVQQLIRLTRPSSLSSTITLWSCFSSCIESDHVVDGEFKPIWLLSRHANAIRFRRCLGRGGKCVFRIYCTKIKHILLNSSRNNGVKGWRNGFDQF